MEFVRDSLVFYNDILDFVVGEVFGRGVESGEIYEVISLENHW